MSDFSYIGAGQIYMREAGAAAPMIAVGNCSALKFSITEEIKSLKDFTQAGGGTYNEVRRIESVEMSMTLHDLNADNVARAVFGDASAIASGSVTDEAHTVYEGGFTPTTFPPSLTGIVVKHTSGSPTYVADTDYTVTEGGIIIIAGGGISDGDSIKISYTKLAGSTIEALLNAAQEYELFFSGLNDARSGKQVRVHAYRVKLGATDGLDLIGEEYWAGTQSGKVLKDSTKNGTTVSQYFKTDIVS